MSPAVAQMHDTGKLRIGIAYIPRQKYEATRDQALTQKALLDKRTAQPLPFINRLIAPIVRWL